MLEEVGQTILVVILEQCANILNYIEACPLLRLAVVLNKIGESVVELPYPDRRVGGDGLVKVNLTIKNSC
jgi:hypothetical protein